MTTITWKGSAGGSWTTSTNWNPTGVPDSSSDTATIDVRSAELFSASETVGAIDIGPSGALLVDYIAGQSGATLTVTGTLTNDGGPAGSHGLAIGNSTGGSTTVTLGALDNATTSSAIGIQNANVTVNGNVFNDGKEFGSAGIGIGFDPGELAATVTVDGSFTNSGALGVGSASTLAIAGTLTNSGGLGSTPATSNGVFIGSITNDLTATATVGTIDNTATGVMSIQGSGSTLTVTGNGSNAGTGSDAGFDLEDGAGVTVDGNFTNTGKLGLDYVDPTAAGSTLTIEGTLTNSGGGTSNGMGIFNAGSSVDVGALNNSGTVFGIGTIQGNVTNSGTVLAGDEITDTPGTLSITGNYSQTSTSTVDEVLNTNGPTFSTIAVTGAVDLSGGTLDLTTPESIGTPHPGNSITLMTSTPGELTGSFASFKYGSTATAGQILEVDGVALQLEYDNAGGTITLNVVNAGVTDTWVGTGPGFGDWTTPSNWTADRVPGSTNNPAGTAYTADSAVIELGGVQITNENAGTIASLTTGPYNNKNRGTFQAGYLVFDDGQLTVSNNVTDQGGIGLDASSGNTGSNFVVLGTLTNSGDTDDHTGIAIGNSEGDGTTTATFGNFVNTSTGGIDIDNATVTVTGNVTNNGDMPGVKGMGVAFFASESASNPDPGVADIGGTLIVDGTYTNNGAFGIGNVDITGLATATVNTLDNTSTGEIAITGNNTADSPAFARLGVTGTGTNAGKINLADNGALEIGGTFSNSGTIALDGVTNPAALQVNDAGLSLTGGGKVTLSNNANNKIVSGGSAATLTNVNNTISGTGTIGGDGFFSLTNDATIDATGEIFLHSATAIGNSGTLEATGTGELVIDNDVSNTSTGVILASGNGIVDLNDIIVNGGTLKTSGSGVIESGDTVLEDAANQGVLSVMDGQELAVDGSTFVNSGTVEVNSLGTNTDFIIEGNVMLTGSGHVTLSDSANNVIDAPSGAATLTNVNNTISGAGTIGDVNNTNLTFDNEGTVNANSSTNPLILNTDTNTIGNTGTLESTASGGLDILSNVANSKTIEALGTSATATIASTITNTSTGVVLASGTGANVQLNQAEIMGGKLETTGTGLIETATGTTSQFSGVTITSGSVVEVNDNTGLALAGTITNSGTIELNAAAHPTTLVILGPAVSLTGSGKVALGGSDSANNVIDAPSGAATLTNVNNTISGAGTIGDVNNTNLTFDNEGTVNANSSTNPLILNTDTNTIGNTGTLESTASGGLDIDSNVANSKTIEALGTNATATIASTITNTSTGVVLASGTGANVQLNQAEIMDGKLETTGTGLIETATGTTSQFSGVTITSGSVVEVNDNTGLALAGTITNSGTIELNAAAHPTTLVILGPAVSLTGSGKVALGGSDSANNVIDAPSGAATLTNVNNTISGAGTIGDVNNTNLTFDNEGTVNANSSTNPLILNTDTNTIGNTGTLESTASGGLDIDSNVANTGGLILASGTGANVNLQGVAVSGGKLQTSGSTAVIEVNGTTDSITGGTIVAASFVEVNNGALTLSDETIGSGAIVEALAGTEVEVTSAVANSGTLFANGALSLVQIAGGAVTGSGKAEVGDGTVEMQGASAENVTFQAGGTGTLQLDGLAYTGKVTGFGQGGTNPNQLIDFSGVTYTGTNSVTYNPTTGVLTVGDGTNSASVTLVGTYTQTSFQTEKVGNSLAIFDPTVIVPGAISVSSGVTSGAITGDLIAESTVTVAASGTFAAENGNNLEVYGALTNSGTTEAAGIASDMNLEGVVTNGGTFEVTSAAAADVQSSVANSGTIETLSGGALLLEQNVTNSNTILAAGNSLMAMGFGTPDAFTITNRGVISATDDSTITMTAGITTSGVTSGGIINQGTITASSNAEIVISGLTNLATLVATGSGTLQLNGPVTNDGTLKVTGNGSIIAGNVSGGIALIDGTGVISGPTDSIELGDSSTDVSFGPGATGLLTLTGPLLTLRSETSSPFYNSAPSAFTGTIAGFTAGDAIDLPNIPYTVSNFEIGGSVTDTVQFVANPNGDGGTLEVSNGFALTPGVLAAINLAGFDPNGGGLGVAAAYVTANFSITSDGHGGTIITDPPVTLQQPGNAPAAVGNGAIVEINTPDSGNATFTGSSGTLVLDQPSTFTGTVAGLGAQNAIDLSGIDFGANTMLGYTGNKSGPGGTLTVADGTHSANVALLGNYMASSFVTESDGHGGTSITDPNLTAANQPTLAAHPA